MGPYIKEWVSEITGTKRKQFSFKDNKKDYFVNRTEL